jgi:hypothetical protein
MMSQGRPPTFPPAVTFLTQTGASLKAVQIPVFVKDAET